MDRFVAARLRIALGPERDEGGSHKADLTPAATA
jgi:hypothetical protein